MKSLLFIYNAKSDYWSKKIDFAHKIISPKTYSCSLCSLTHGNYGETEAWKNFRINALIEMEFIYKNEFEKLYAKKINYPAVFSKNTSSQNLTLLLTAKDLKQLKSVEDLIEKIKLTN